MLDKRTDFSVLIVDDEPFVLRTTAHQVKRLGFDSVITAQSAERALELLGDADPAVGLVVTDLNMPGVDGVELLRHFDQSGFCGDVVLISGEDSQTLLMAENLARARNLRVLGSVAKPVCPIQLSRVLARSAPSNALPGGKVRSPRVSAERLASAIRHGEFEPWFQPKVDIATRQPVGVEMLARWPNSEMGPVFPDTFIPVAEAAGLIDPLTYLLTDKAVKSARHWRDLGLNLKVAINVSMDSLRKPDLPDRLYSLIVEQGDLADFYQIEVTESRLMEDLVTPLEVLLRLRMRRFKLSVDDFGTGHSNLSQLRSLPFDELKLDRSYVQESADGGRTRALLESSVEIAKRLHMSIVAEGVETLEDWRRMERLGCDQVQGYFIARPMPAGEIPNWMSSWPETRNRLFGEG